MRDAICFDDVLLAPQYSDIKSRTQINLDVEFSNDVLLKIPIISSPMDTITEVSMATALHVAGGLGIIHRYNTVEEQSSLVYSSRNGGATTVGAAIGVSEDYLKRARSLAKSGASIICIDIAHGHHILMKSALRALRDDPYIRDLHLMAGNVATLEGFNALADWGADSIRVGVGGGSICSTRIQTGHGIPTLQSVIDCARSDRDVLLLADGGIKNSGDITKCLASGADAVMVGSLLAGTNETPGDIIYHKGSPPRKIYRGMASREAQKSWRNKIGSVEGVATTVALKGPVVDILNDLAWGVKSGLSYSGARDLKEFRCKAKLIKQSPASQVESLPHALHN